MEYIELNREHWTEKDGQMFQKYLKTLSKGEEKGLWEQRIINTKMPCVAVPSSDVSKIIKQIAKGNFLEFIDLWLWENFTNTSIIGNLICKIKDFNIFKKNILIYADKADNWATVDCLKFVIKENNKKEYFDLAKQLVKSNKEFVKRLGVTILFKFVDDDKYINDIFEILDTFECETQYYVNMVNAWLVAECFTKQRDKTLEYLKRHKLNIFTINKAIQKCRDSFRISAEDKEMLKVFKKQKNN